MMVLLCVSEISLHCRWLGAHPLSQQPGLCRAVDTEIATHSIGLYTIIKLKRGCKSCYSSSGARGVLSSLSRGCSTVSQRKLLGSLCNTTRILIPSEHEFLLHTAPKHRDRFRAG